MGNPATPTVQATPALLMQRAVNLLYGGNDPLTNQPSLEATRAAQALTGMARELRLGTYGRSSGRGSGSYSSVVVPADLTEEVVSFAWRRAEGAVGYDIHLKAGEVNVTPIYAPDELVAESEDT